LGPPNFSSAAKTAASRTNHGINNQADELVVTSALDELYGDAPGWRRGAHVQGGQQRRNLPGTQEPERRLKEQTSEAVPPEIYVCLVFHLAGRVRRWDVAALQ